MPMKPKPNKHDRRSYNQSPGNARRELDKHRSRLSRCLECYQRSTPTGPFEVTFLTTMRSVPDPNSGVRKDCQAQGLHTK